MKIERNRFWTLMLRLSSGDGEDYKGCRFTMACLGWHISIPLPPLLWPYREKVFPESWGPDTVARLGRNWYWNYDEREYGFSISDGHLSVYLGRQTDDSSTEQRWSCFLPWTQWRCVRHSFYDLNGEHVWTEPPQCPWEERRAVEDSLPKARFQFTDFDGEVIEASTNIEEREWLFGEGWFKWLSLFRAPMIRRSLNINFSKEVGPKKGSWKGGTLGHGIDMLPGELHAAAFKRYCEKYKLTLRAA